jgi:RNA polymerase sigma factor (sigma-70 family)
MASRSQVTATAHLLSKASIAAQADTKVSTKTTDELAADAQKGCHRAFADLVKHCQRFVTTKIGSRINQRDRVEDISQEVWLAVARNIGSYDPTRSFIPWLAKIVSNKVIDSMRLKDPEFNRQMHTITPVNGGGDSFEIVDSRQESPLARLEKAEALERIRERVKLTLPEDLHYLAYVFSGEMTIPHAAATFGVAEGTIKSRMYRYRSKLREAA